MASASFHVFLSHNSTDKPAVEVLAQRLKADGLESWLDKWHLIPGEPWQQALEQALTDSKSVAVFVGPSGFGPWQNEEMRAALAKRVSQSDGRFRVIPVLLPGGEREERSRLPAFLLASTWVEFRKSIDDDEAYHRLKSGILGLAPGLSPGELIYEGQCPYRGLQAFQPEHSAFFFGREARIEWLLNALRPAQVFDSAGIPRENRFLAIVGASGSGKSSLARAGLVPAIRDGKLEGSENWPIVICRPGHDPLESLAVALAGDARIGPRLGDVSELISKMESNESRLHLAARVALGSAPESERVVLLIDQFEEVFTLHSEDMSGTRASRSFRDLSLVRTSDSRRKAFIDNLIYAAGIAGGKTIVVLTMRADFYSKCAAHPHLAAALTDHQELVGPMTKSELREVIDRPAQMVGLELERGLTEMLLSEMEDQPGALPLLQHALWELWQRREGRRLTIAAHEAIGGLEGALEQQANSIFDGMSASEQETCRRIFLRLTQPGEGSEDTKRRVAMTQLGDSGAISSVINRLTNVRLITAEKDSFVEVSHEALIRSWSKLRGWIEADRESLRTQHRLTEAAAEWSSSERDSGYLYQGARLAEAEEWSKTPEADLTHEEREFLLTSVDQRDQGKREEAERRAREVETLKKLAQSESERACDQAKAARRSRWQTRAALAFATVAMAAFLWAAVAQRRAERNARLTEEARKQIEETLASNLLERVHLSPGPFGVNEFVAFWQIAALPAEHEHLRMRVLSKGFEKDADAVRLNNRAPNFALSIIGLDVDRRAVALNDTILPVLKSTSASQEFCLAAVRMGIALRIEGVEFAEQAVRSLSQAIIKTNDFELIDGLAKDLSTAIRSIPQEESQRVIGPLVEAIDRTANARVLRRLCDAVGALPRQMLSIDGRRVADRLIAVMENEPRPEVLRELSDCLSSLPQDLKVINSNRGIKFVIRAIESTKRPEVHNGLVAAVTTASKRLNLVECQTTSDEIISAIRETPDSESVQVLAQCLSAVAFRVSQFDGTQGTNLILEGMNTTKEADPLRELCSGLVRLRSHVSDKSAHVAITRLLNVMSAEKSSRDLRVLAECLSLVPGTMTNDEIEKAKTCFFDFFAHPSVMPPDLLELTTGLSSLPTTLTTTECLQVNQAFIAALDKVPRTESIRDIGKGMEALGKNLTPATAAAVGDMILAKMAITNDAERILALSHGLNGMKLGIDSKSIARAYQLLREKLRDPMFLLPIDLILLVESLATVPDNIPEEVADDAIRRMLVVLESTENSEILRMVVDKMGLVGGDISSEVGHQTISQILEKIRNSRETSLFRLLALGLASVAYELERVGKFTDSDAAEVTERLSLAMDVTVEPAALVRLAETLEKIAPKLPQTDDQSVARRVIQQNLRSIEATHDPMVIGQLARIWQVMAGRMTQQETHDAFEKILEANKEQANKGVRPELCQAAVALATSADAMRAKHSLVHLLLALHNDHDENVLEIMLDGIETLSQRIPQSDANEAKMAIIATTGDHSRMSELVLDRLIKSLARLQGGLQISEMVELLKSPYCTGNAQQSLLTMIEEKTQLQFHGNPWNFVSAAKESGIDPAIFRRPVQQPEPLLAIERPSERLSARK